MRHQAVESANPGDKACFTGMLVVVPDISAMALPGNVSVKSELKGFVKLTAEAQLPACGFVSVAS